LNHTEMVLNAGPLLACTAEAGLLRVPSCNHCSIVVEGSAKDLAHDHFSVCLFMKNNLTSIQCKGVSYSLLSLAHGTVVDNAEHMHPVAQQLNRAVTRNWKHAK
jgi:hypothetical protein